MFSIISLRNNIDLKPNQIGSNIYNQISNELKHRFEKKILGKIDGYIINIVHVHKDIKNQKINDINGSVNYDIQYTAVVVKPIKDQSVNIKITTCNGAGIWGHLTLLNDVEMIECIVPEHYLLNYKYDDIKEEWVKYDGTNSLKIFSSVDIKIINYTIDINKIIIIGSL